MSLLPRLERKFGWLAIPNITTILIAGQVLLFGVLLMRRGEGGVDLLANIYLIPSKVLEGEVWRLVTFLFTPPENSSIFVIFFWMLFYLFGTTLEHQWGTFRYNVYLLIGYVANVAAAFLVWFVWSRSVDLAAQPMLATRGLTATNAFLYGTVFLAFARLYPNFTLNLFFILPIQVKWLALLMWLGYGYAFLSNGPMVKLLIVASVLNYLLFFGPGHWRELRQRGRRRSYQAKTQKASSRLVHRCRVCGLTSEESPKTLFRYCSKCAGQACYCPEHIGNHEHVVAPEADKAEKEP